MKSILTLVIINFFLSAVYSQSSIAVWNYNTIVGSPTAPVADLGTGTSSIVGSFVVAAAATGMDPIINNGCGSQNGVNPGAWAFTATPGATDESSGVQYNVSTLGFQNIFFTWDQRSSNTATNTMRVKYTLDGTTWLDFVMTELNTTYCSGVLDGGRFQNSAVGDNYRRVSINFSAITGANNNANFAVRVLAAHYQTTGQFRQTGNPTLVATGGTWRFDNVSVEGRSNVSIIAANNFIQVNENVGTVVVPITVSNANSNPIVLNLGFSTYSNATLNDDFTMSSTVTIPANTNGVFNHTITIVDDVLAEKAERIIVKILNGSNALVSSTDNYRIMFIADNDLQAPAQTNELNMNLLSSFSNGAAGTNSAEIVTFDSDVDRMYIANSIGAKLDIVNFANPSNPILISSIAMAPYGNINSVVAHDSIIALAVENSNPQLNGSVVILDYNGNFLKQVTVGAMPDMITFNKNYTKILTANEGEPNATYTVDPEGSVSIIDISGGISSLTQANVTTLGLTAFNTQSSTLLAQGIRLFSTSATVAQDLEPEYIAISDDNTKAYVAIQEANALLTIDLTTNSIVSLSALGYSQYNTGSGNALDASDQSGAILITGDLPIKGAYMPDAISYATIGGQGYIFTANEGDSREFATVIDANRISSSVFANLDPLAFPDAAILKNNKFLGRLSALKYSGDTDGDGDYDELHVMSGRSFSIRNATTGAVVFDSKDLLEQITSKHPYFGSIFNASNTVGAPALKNRSDDKGPEIEGITVHEFNGAMYAFVSSERLGGVFIFNVQNPSTPNFVGYYNNRSNTASGPDLGAEGIIFISAAESPNGNPLVILANEVSSTLSIYQLNTCSSIAGAEINSSLTGFCQGSTASLSIPGATGSSYQWLLNGNPITGSTGITCSITQGGNYSVLVSNSVLGCTDTSNVKSITTYSLPSVNAGLDQAVCTGGSVTLTASGVNTYTWDNGVSNAISFMPSTTQLYTLTGIDANGCSNTDQVQVTVNALPIVDAGINQTICAGSSVVFSGSGASNYTWNNGVVNSVSFIPTASQTYTVTGEDANGCSNTDDILVTVNALPTVDAGINQTVCAGSSVVFSGSGASTYTWNNGVVNSVSFIPTASQTYTVTGLDANGCSNTDQVTLTVNDLPTVDAGINQTVCAGSTVVFSGSGASTYTWNNGLVNSVSFIPTASQTYTVTGVDANGCANSDQVTLTVNDLPTIDAGINQTICLGESVILSASGAITYSWNNSVVNGVSFIPLATQIYTCFGVDGFGCQNTNQVTVVVNPLPIVIAGLDQAICFGDSITLTATGATNYTWNNGITNATAFAPSATLTYTVTGVNQNNCSNSDQIVVTVNALPIINAGVDQTTCSGTEVVLNATGSNSLSWNNGVVNGLYFTPTSTQSYLVTGTDVNNCSNTDEVQITVNSLPTISAGEDQTICPGASVTLNATGGINYQWNNGVTNGNSFIPTATQSYVATGSDINGCSNSDTVLVTVIDCTGIEEQEDVTVSVYPNPIQDLLHFDFHQLISGVIELVSVEGKLISSVEINELETFEMDLSSLAFGPYFIRMNVNGNVKSLKVIKAN